jgi:hypothetical protein
MRSTEQVRLWRVDWVHKSGYRAPYMYVEAKNYKEAHREVMGMKCRLADFPTWYFQLTALDLVQKRGKWVSL